MVLNKGEIHVGETCRQVGEACFRQLKAHLPCSPGVLWLSVRQSCCIGDSTVVLGAAEDVCLPPTVL